MSKRDLNIELYIHTEFFKIFFLSSRQIFEAFSSSQKAPTMWKFSIYQNAKILYILSKYFTRAVSLLLIYMNPRPGTDVPFVPQ